MDREELTNLNPGDLLFVDSTHTVKPGSEVNRIILDVLPRLAKEVYVHFHDIYFPYDYQRGLITEDVFFNVESTLLHAFLIDNRKYKIYFSLSMLHYFAPDRIKSCFPSYSQQSNADGLRAEVGGHFPSAIYLVTTSDPDV